MKVSCVASEGLRAPDEADEEGSDMVLGLCCAVCEVAVGLRRDCCGGEVGSWLCFELVD